MGKEAEVTLCQKGERDCFHERCEKRGIKVIYEGDGTNENSVA